MADNSGIIDVGIVFGLTNLKIVFTNRKEPSSKIQLSQILHS
jgi:hypothetical protein